MNKRMTGWFGGWMLALFIAAAAGAEDTNDLCGKYDIQGWEPNGDTCSTPDYIGTSEFSKKGGVYVYRGAVDQVTFEGIGYAEGKTVYFAYRGTDGDSGILRGKNNNGIWVCEWVSANSADGKPGKEIWKKQRPPVSAGNTGSDEQR